MCVWVVQCWFLMSYMFSWIEKALKANIVFTIRSLHRFVCMVNTISSPPPPSLFPFFPFSCLLKWPHLATALWRYLQNIIEFLNYLVCSHACEPVICLSKAPQYTYTLCTIQMADIQLTVRVCVITIKHFSPVDEYKLCRFYYQSRSSNFNFFNAQNRPLHVHVIVYIGLLTTRAVAEYLKIP